MAIATSEPISALTDSRTTPPPQRDGIVPRERLMERMAEHQNRRILALSAPPGYGKTTALAQYSSGLSRPVAWLSIDPADNDPAVLLLDAASALCRVDLIDPAVVDSLRSPALSPSGALGRLTPAIAAAGPVTVVLDHLEQITNPDATDVLAGLAACLSDGSQLALATRGQHPFQASTLRTSGDLAEIGVAELAMSRQEAEMLFATVGVRFDRDEIDRLVDHTEGWPVGLYLAALAAKLGPSKRVSEFAFRGDDRLMRDYLRAEFFGKLDAGTVEFLTRTAVLEHLSGSLCDRVLDRTGSQAMLESIETSNMLLVPLDRHRQWFRYHHLFRDLLLAELLTNEPDLVQTLHSRAAAWFETNRMVEQAITHAQRANDAEQVARLVAASSQRMYAAGRATTVRGWFDWFHTEDQIDRYPEIATLGGLVESLQGHPAAAERWALAAERGTNTNALPDGSDIEGWRSFLRAISCRSGVAVMRSDAQAAQAALSPGSPFRAATITLEGLSYVLEGDLETADPILAHAVEVSLYFGAAAAGCMAISERALIAVSRGEWDDARELTQRGLEMVQAQHYDSYLETTLIYIVAARVALHDGDHPLAAELAGKAARLRPVLTYAVPVTAQFLIELGKVYLALADPSGTRTVLREAQDIMRQRPNLGTLPEQAAQLQHELQAVRDTSMAASSLTVAELRLMPYLATHLSFREIGERLHVSRNTVKTHSISIYRKLGVSNRSEAIVRANEIGLLGT